MAAGAGSLTTCFLGALQASLSVLLTIGYGGFGGADGVGAPGEREGSEPGLREDVFAGAIGCGGWGGGAEDGDGGAVCAGFGCVGSFFSILSIHAGAWGVLDSRERGLGVCVGVCEDGWLIDGVGRW